MIDLHMHTEHSDGSDSVTSLLKKAKEYNLEVISITDHDNMDAYIEMQKLNVHELYDGKIINGVEITTAINGYRIELLAYDVDNIDIVNNYLKNSIDTEAYIEYKKDKRFELVKKFEKLNLKYDENLLNSIRDEFRFENLLYTSILENNDNVKDVMGDEYCNTGYEFYRNCITEPKSAFHINLTKFYLDINEIINVIHQNNGKLFLAHPFLYDLDNIEEILNKLVKLKIDGIECYYSSFSDEQTSFLLNYCNKNNLLISGGTDYHGNKRQKIDIGVGMGNLNISKDIISNWHKKKLVSKN